MEALQMQMELYYHCLSEKLGPYDLVNKHPYIFINKIDNFTIL